jgi:hypothetical protein
VRLLGKRGTLQLEKRLHVGRHIVGFHRFDHVGDSNKHMLVAAAAASAEQVH